ncbi:hypothetical protein [Massilia antarctica]|uniref:hypothetical protein n=1 Tax=Massilia antarctica TaxID=2765360 RepID=UPI001E4D3E6B|nr:hypothetical protein [Massilia antarctica]
MVETFSCEYHVKCDECGACGPCADDYGRLGEQIVSEMEALEHDGRCSGIYELVEKSGAKKVFDAIVNWNRMHALIAKGLLVEGEAAAGRETKGRL